MNKQEYMMELQKALKKLNISDIDEIVEEYEQHFINKLADGYSEEEITAKLGKPQLIAEQFAENSSSTKGSAKSVMSIGFAFLDIIFAAIMICLYSTVIVLGAFSVASMIIGADLLFQFHFISYIPLMPYSGALFFGLSFLALSALGMMATIYSHLTVCQWARAFIRFQKNSLTNRHYPNMPLSPNFSLKKKRLMRTIIIISLMIFGIASVSGYISLASYTKSLEFWHALGWFI